MSLFTVGRLCLKVAGRDSNRKCVVVEEVDNLFVIVDGDVRRKKVNIKHLEPLREMVDLKNTSHEGVKKAFASLGLAVWETKPKQSGQRLKRQKKVKPQVEEQPAPKAKKAKKSGSASPEVVAETA